MSDKRLSFIGGLCWRKRDAGVIFPNLQGARVQTKHLEHVPVPVPSLGGGWLLQAQRSGGCRWAVKTGKEGRAGQDIASSPSDTNDATAQYREGAKHKVLKKAAAFSAGGVPGRHKI